MSSIQILAFPNTRFDLLKTIATTEKALWNSVDMKAFDTPYLDIYFYVYVTKNVNRGNNLHKSFMQMHKIHAFSIFITLNK